MTKWDGDQQIQYLRHKKLLTKDYDNKKYISLGLTDQARINHLFSQEYFEDPNIIRDFFKSLPMQDDIPDDVA